MIFSKQKKLLTLVGSLLVGTMLFAGCGGSSKQEAAGSGSDKKAAVLEGKVSASGSTALLPLLKPAQESFQSKNPKVTTCRQNIKIKGW